MSIDRGPLRNVAGQMGYCGIWCGSCVVGNGAMMEIARRYHELVESHGLGHWGAAGFDYPEFLKGLESIAGIAVCPGCLRGGGRDDCALRNCASARGIRSCVACAARGDCSNADDLDRMRSGARAAGLAVVDAEEEGGRFLEAGDSELRSRWWWRAVFEEDG